MISLPSRRALLTTIAAGGVAFAFAWPLAAQAGIGSIVVEAGGMDEFSPQTESYNLLASPNFDWHWDGDGITDREHNVRQDAGLFRSGDLTTSPPGGHYALTASAGTFPYYCEQHGGPGGEGMSGVIQVAPAVNHKDLDGIRLQWATTESQTGSAYDVRYRVDDNRWKIWRNDTSALRGNFGRNGRPITLQDNRVYSFAARSEKARNPDRRSKWSPQVVVSFIL